MDYTDQMRPDFNPFWYGPSYVPPMDLAQQQQAWEQCGTFMADVLTSMCARYYRSLKDEGLPEGLIGAMVRGYQSTWLMAFFSEPYIIPKDEWGIAWDQDEDDPNG